MSAPPDKISDLFHSMQSCISEVKAWATANMLKLNVNKKELMFVTSKGTKRLNNLPTSITIGNVLIPLKQSEKNFGFTHTCNTRSSTMSLLSRSAHNKATLGDSSFSFASNYVWNSIKNDVRCAPSLSSFKSCLKT